MGGCGGALKCGVRVRTDGIRLPVVSDFRVSDVTYTMLSAAIRFHWLFFPHFFHHFSSDGPVMEVTSQFLYRGTYTDYENTFQRKVETPVEAHLSSTKDVAVSRSKEWFHLNDSYDGPSQQDAHVPAVQLRPLQEPDRVRLGRDDGSGAARTR